MVASLREMSIEAMHFKSERKLTFFVLAAVLSSLLIISAFSSLSSAQSSIVSVPCTITTTGNAWNGELAFGAWVYNGLSVSWKNL